MGLHLGKEGGAEEVGESRNLKQTALDPTVQILSPRLAVIWGKSFLHLTFSHL